MEYFGENEMDALSGETGKLLAAEPRVTVVIEPDGDDRPWTGAINGYFFTIKKGEAVEVPRSVAELIMENARAKALSFSSMGAYRTGRGRKL